MQIYEKNFVILHRLRNYFLPYAKKVKCNNTINLLNFLSNDKSCN